MIRIMEKNYFAALNYHLSAALGSGVLGVVPWGGAVVGPFTGMLAGCSAALGMLSLALPAAVAASRLGWPRRTALLTPLVFPLLFYALLNSAVVTLRQGGIYWRGTFYPLGILRQGMVG